MKSESSPLFFPFLPEALAFVLGAQTVLSGTGAAKQAAPGFSYFCPAKRPVYCLQCNFLPIAPQQKIIIKFSCLQAMKSLCYRKAASKEWNVEWRIFCTVLSQFAKSVRRGFPPPPSKKRIVRTSGQEPLILLPEYCSNIKIPMISSVFLVFVFQSVFLNLWWSYFGSA